MRGFLTLLLIVAFLVPGLSALADLATSTSFQIERGVIDVGGSRATSSGFNLNTSLGQQGTGISTSTSFTLRGGFLHFVQPAETPTPTPTPSAGTPSSLPGGLAAGTGFIFPPIERKELIPPEIVAICDFNGDDRCNIIDLSILLYYYDMSGRRVARYDLNRNTTVDFPDVSVLMYYWTG